MPDQRAEAVLKAFENFLAQVPMETYRQALMPIKTVEQDLPKALNPLPAIYDAYWTSEPRDFLPYDDFFEKWWQDHKKPLEAFIRKYFWGCCHEFVYQGFKARIYRTWVSVLTQFHFAYLWRTYVVFPPLKASAEWDMQGIDAVVEYAEENVRVGLQVKKVSYRYEARGPSRFARRKHQVHLVVEVPYTVTPAKTWQQRASRARKPHTKQQAEMFAWLATHLQRWFPNGFVVFQPKYPLLVKRLIREQARFGREEIRWHETLTFARDHLSAEKG